jgi:O-antigen ligase
MLSAIKNLFRGLVPLSLYLGVMATAAYSVFRNARYGMFLIIILSANPNIWLTVHAFPMGKDSIDILFFAVAIGISTNCGGYEAPPRLWLICLYLAMFYVSALVCSANFNLGVPVSMSHRLVPDLKNFMEMVLLYVLAYNVFKKEEDQKLAVLLMAAVLLFVCLREMRNFTAGSSFNYDKRSSGPLWTVGLGPNHFGAFVAYCCAFFSGLYAVDKDRKRRWFYLGAIAMSIYPLFSTYSRGSWAALVCALAVLGVLKKPTLLIGLFILAISWQTVLPEAVVDRITMTESPEGEIEESAALRLLLWERAKEIFADNPVFGIGYHGFSFAVEIKKLTNVHNYFMQTAAEQGVIGLLFLGALLFACAVTSFGLFRNGRSDFQKGLGLGMLATVTAVSIANIFGDRWSYFQVAAWFWIMWGISDRAAHNARTAEATDTTAATERPLRRRPDVATAGARNR